MQWGDWKHDPGLTYNIRPGLGDKSITIYMAMLARHVWWLTLVFSNIMLSLNSIILLCRGWLYNATMATLRLCDDGVKRKECRTEVAKSYYSLFLIYIGVIVANYYLSIYHCELLINLTEIRDGLRPLLAPLWRKLNNWVTPTVPDSSVFFSPFLSSLKTQKLDV
jgi:hypothetical protein